MSQQETYTKQESYKSSSYMTEANNTYRNFPTNDHSSPKSQNRYSSPAQSPLRTPSAQQQSRHYATPEESEAVLPVFTTPTHMYLRQELNPQQRYSPSQPGYSSPAPSSLNNNQYSTTASARQNYSSTQQHQTYTKNSPSTFDPLAKFESNTPLSSTYRYNGRSRGDSTPSRPSMDHFGMNSTKSEINSMKSGNQSEQNNYTATSNGTSSFSSSSSASSTKDMLLAQLVDMGFSLEASRVAITASGSTDLQKVLDILVQNEQVEEQIPVSTKSFPRTNRARMSSDDGEEQEDPRVEREQEESWKKQQEERRKEYLDQLKRNKPTPPIPNQQPASHNNTNANASTFSSTYQSSSAASSHFNTPPPRMDPMTVYADKERKQGNFFFSKGKYSEAEHAYSLSIGSLPSGHGDLVLLCNNRAAARLKQSKYQDCLTDCSLAIDLARKNMNSNVPMTSLMRDASTTMKAQLMKALHRKASALEGLCLFEAAIQAYEEYVRLDGSRSAQVTQGIMRCQQSLLDSKKKQQEGWKPATSADNNATAFPDIDFNLFIPKPTSQYTEAELDEINKSQAVKEMRDREKQREAEEAERLEKEDVVNSKIANWRKGKDKNLRALLGSLDLILWPSVQWKGVMMSELLEPRKCKVTYMKAIAKVHPDKLPANATVEQRMLANGIFTTLNQAWDAFKTENNL